MGYLDLPLLRRKTDAKGGIVLIKFFEGTWHCVGVSLPPSRHLSKQTARVHVLFTWKNFILKSIDHNGHLETEDFRDQPRAASKTARDIWCPPPLPEPTKEPAEPAWLPRGRAK